MNSLSAQREVWGIIALQTVAVCFFTVAVMAGVTVLAGAAFLLGGLIALMANIYFCFRVFSHCGARAAKKIVMALYHGEAVKVAISAVGFYVAFTIPWASPMWVLLGYGVAQIGFAMASFFVSFVANKKIEIGTVAR